MTGLEVKPNEVRFLTPCTPSKVICMGVNDNDHAIEMGKELPHEPLMFIKPPTSVIGPGEEIVFPSLVENVHYRSALAVVIKKEACHVKAEDADDYILGFTCAIDLTARDLQARDGEWSRAKELDTFCPLGPAISPKLDYNNLRIVTKVNGEVRQDSNTSQMAVKIPGIIEAVTAVMTLLPGDVIITGTPSGVGSLQPGDEISVTIEGIGTLANRVVAEKI